MKRFELFLMVLQVPVDFFMLILSGIAAYALRFTPWALSLRPVTFDISASEYLSIITWVAVGWVLIFALAGLYSADPNRKLSADVSRVFFACTAGLATVAMYLLFTQQLFDSRFLVAVGWAAAVCFVLAGRLLLRGVKGLLYRAGVGQRRMVVFGGGGVADAIIRSLRARPELGFAVSASFPRATDASLRQALAAHPDEILLTNARANEEETLRVLNFCREHQIVCKYSADLFSTYSANTAVQPLAGVPVVELRPTRLEGWGRVLKRLFDIAASIAVLALASPIMLVAALAILLETGRPVLFKNERIGRQGKRFCTLKFRSMRQEYCIGPQFKKTSGAAIRFEKKLIETNNTKEGPVYKIANDPRVTPVGRFLRRWSLDELPQFFNVLGGSMSVVGPRPHQPREVAEYEAEHKLVFHMKPGITGLSQISGRSDLSFEEEIRLDVLYMEKWSMLLDLIIFMKTPFILFKKRKAL